MSALTTPAAHDVKTRASGPLPAYRVWLHDPWCRTPWYSAELARGLEQAGHSVRLVSSSYRLEPGYFASRQLRPQPGLLDAASKLPLRNSALSNAARLAEYGMNTAALLHELKTRPPQIIHQQQCVLLERGWKAELSFLRAAKSHGVPVVHTVHNLLPHTAKPFHEEIFRRLYHACDALICHDSSTADRLCSQFQIPENRVYVIPHGPLFAEPSLHTPQQCRTLLNLPPARQILLALGVLAPYKGIDILLEAFERFLLSTTTSGKPLLVIAGTGSKTEEARVRARANQVVASGDVRTDLYYIPAQQIPLYMQAADVLLYPYREITTSGALLTGLNYCKPIVASDLPPFRPYLTPECNSKVVPAGDVASLARALQDLSDPKVFARLSRGSRDNRALQVQWDSISMQTTAVYRSVLG